MCDSPKSEQSRAFYAAQHGLSDMNQTATNQAVKVPLLELEEKKLAHLEYQISRQLHLVELLKKHPEYEDYDQIAELRACR